MSSREIAELTGKLHKNVLADIRNTLDALGLDWADFLAQYIDSTGRALPCFSLPLREVEILLTGYSIPLRTKVIDRLHELEAAVARPAIRTSFAEALRLAAALEEGKAGPGRDSQRAASLPANAGRVSFRASHG